MVRKTVPKGEKKYFYFSCSTNRDDKKACTTHSINESSCEKAVFLSLKAHIDSILNVEKALHCIDSLPYQQEAARKINAQIVKKQSEVERYNNLRLAIYEDYKAGIVTKEDFINYKKSYDMKIADAEIAIRKQSNELENIASSDTVSNSWIEKFKEYHSIESLNRKTVAELIEKIYIYEGKRMEIIFRYQNEYDRLISYLHMSDPSKQAVI